MQIYFATLCVYFEQKKVEENINRGFDSTIIAHVYYLNTIFYEDYIVLFFIIINVKWTLFKHS